LGDSAVTVWSIAKWPLIALVLSQIVALLYWVAPNVRQPSYRWIGPGSLLAVALWLVASVAFASYVANFGSFNATYGSVAGVIVFLVWLWIGNATILLGVTVTPSSSATERSRGVILSTASRFCRRARPRGSASSALDAWAGTSRAPRSSMATTWSASIATSASRPRSRERASRPLRHSRSSWPSSRHRGPSSCQVVLDDRDDWSEHQPSAAQENALPLETDRFAWS
jgi:hypothetical protein